jgi:hypothetical protein
MVLPKISNFSPHYPQFNLISIFVFSLLTASSAIYLSPQPTPASIPDRLADGVYLFGESVEPSITGKEYIIFETRQGKTVGAFYLPRSEFSCFSGKIEDGKLNVRLVDTYDRQVYNYSLALNPNGLTASKQPLMGSPSYYPLEKVSQNDLHMLNACKLELKQIDY